MKEILNWDDIQCTAIMEFENGIAPGLQFKVYAVMGERVSGVNSGEKVYEKKGSTNSEDETSDLENAQPLLAGRIKWDSCSHVYFGDDGYIHLCGVYSWRQIYKAINKVWEYAKSKEFKEEDFKES